MIVKCEQCQTRFKIPDDKVTDKGVKVRCNKCSHTFRVTRDMDQSAAAAPAAQNKPAPPPYPQKSAPPATDDPFARFGLAADPPDAEVTRPGVHLAGLAASRRADSAPAFDFGALSPPVSSPPTMPSVPALGTPEPAAAAPFDFSAVAPPSSEAPAAPSAFDFSAFAAPTASPAMPPTAPAAAPAAFDFAALGAPQSPETPAAPAAFDFAPPADAPPPMSIGDAQTQQVAAFGGGFLGAPDEPAAPTLPSFDGAAARAMFDLPPPPPEPEVPTLPPPDPEDLIGAPIAPGATVAKAATATALPVVEMPEAPRRRKGVVGVIVNVLVAGLLVLGLVVVGSAYLNDGKFSVDSLSAENLKNTFAPSVPFVATDVTNGLYDTKAGRAVFYVRGEVGNRSEESVKLLVTAEIVENGKVVRSSEAVAGQPPTPEELYLVDGADALVALQRRLEKRATVVEPGGQASFVVAFTEYPPDLKGFSVRVAARPVPASAPAKNGE